MKKTVFITSLIIISCLGIYITMSIFTRTSLGNVVYMDDVAEIKTPNFIKRPAESDVKADPLPGKTSFLNYYWVGKTYSDFEGGVNRSPWHLIVTIYDNDKNISDLESYITHSAVGSIKDKDNRSVEGIRYSLTGVDDIFVQDLVSSFKPFTSKDGVGIQTAEFTCLLPRRFSPETTPVLTHLILITDINKSIRLLLNVPKDEYSLEEAVGIASEISSSISLHPDSLTRYFEHLKSIPVDPFDLFKDGKASVQDVLSKLSLDDLKKDLVSRLNLPKEAFDEPNANVFKIYAEAYKSKFPNDTEFVTQINAKLTEISK